MNALTRNYIHQAGGGVGPVYSIAPFVQRGHGIGDILSGLFRTIIPLFFTDIRTASNEEANVLGREALRTGGRILSVIADNTQVRVHDIISKHVQDPFQNLSTKMNGRGRKRKRLSTSLIRRKFKRPKRTLSRL